MCTARLFLIVAVASFFPSCELFHLDELQKTNVYENCCKTESREDTLGGIFFSIPNAITPGSDDRNDAFSIFSSSALIIDSLEITAASGVLSIARFDIAVNGWTDIWVPRSASGNVIFGLYNYSILLSDNRGNMRRVLGSFCAISCEEEEINVIDFNNCHLQTQSDTRGQFSRDTTRSAPCK